MKIFNIENNHEVVYVEINDLIYLKRKGDLPEEIKSSALNSGVIKCETLNDSADYIRFEDFNIITFFKLKDEIIDYKQVRDLSILELEEIGDTLNEELNKIKRTYSRPNDLYQLEKMKQLMSALSYKATSLEKIYLSKLFEENLPLPSIVDSHGITYEEESLIASSSIMNDQIIITRKDGEIIPDESEISLDFIEKVLSLFIFKRTKEHPLSKNIYYSFIGLSDDQLNLIVDYTHYKPQKETKKENIFKKLIKKITPSKS